MKTFLIAYAAVLVAYLILDGIWLGLVARADYVNSIGHLMRDQVLIYPWILFYTLYSAAIVILVVQPHLAAPLSKVALYGAILGFAAYGAYNATNLAIIKTWPVGITIKDLLWGTFVTAATASAGYLAASKFSS